MRYDQRADNARNTSQLHVADQQAKYCREEEHKTLRISLTSHLRFNTLRLHFALQNTRENDHRRFVDKHHVKRTYTFICLRGDCHYQSRFAYFFAFGTICAVYFLPTDINSLY